ncbi:hypothetical protein [Patulibacter americanus]|jgi:hypothetical protein|uniref:hypothetical protein n=1 Tax=Patulibacter americanus TaxID=588672 RepID=UPI0003B4C955|nr:hypothetical protein [Patulibacter americanus]
MHAEHRFDDLLSGLTAYTSAEELTKDVAAADGYDAAAVSPATPATPSSWPCVQASASLVSSSITGTWAVGC